MKKLGLIGGTGPESTVIYYKSITSEIQKSCGNFPMLSIESMSVYDVFRFCEEKDFEGLAQYLLSGVTNLKNAGCDFAALTGITPHMVYAEVAEKSPIPIISMVDTTVEYVLQKGCRRLGLLGTAPTMEMDFFRQPFIRRGIKVVTPEKEERDFVHRKISEELELGNVTENAVGGLAHIVNRMMGEEKVEAVVLGCTELPLAFARIPLPIEKIDVMQIHIHALCKRIMEQ